ncbi:DUF1365 domain-containing protein [Allorhizobium sp. BGMRC 0089]|uniref:DUF1365 domain-containing protein n=1 Tax=Allorhizobium sonneratiae TaxID=2934936 RepID=UPI0020343659|nr:DUF1365 domain-containing protein [Allorhizobium sonneratiae]MCM2291802.1 DUF1365 domain-containing protein [Allorhizobium sonneratiae]
MSFSSALFAGEVFHQRHRPKQHRLRYRVFSLLIDLDEMERLDRSLRLFGLNRFAPLSLYESDHGEGREGGLKDWVACQLQRAGLDTRALSVSMLCYPRIFGYVFNPLTVYFCRDGDNRLIAILYEVENTFHERHTYIIPASSGTQTSLQHECRKDMYVSPFIGMDCRYHFRIKPPDDTVLIAIDETDDEGSLLYASFTGRRKALSDRTLLKALLFYPLMTLKIMGAIHWEALRLWLKGIPLHRHHKAARPVQTTIVHPASDLTCSDLTRSSP